MIRDGGPALSELGALAVVEVNGVRSLIPLKGLVESPVALQALLRGIVDIIGPEDVVRGLLADCKEKPLLEEMDVEALEREGRAAAAEEEQEALERDRKRREYQLVDATPLPSATLEQQEKRWYARMAPSYRRRQQAALDKEKPLTAALLAATYRIPCEVRAAREAAEVACRAAWAERIQKATAAFWAGQRDWQRHLWREKQ